MYPVYLNGEFLPAEQARIPVMDRGFLFGDGVYEVIPAYNGHLFRLDQHLERLDNSLRAIRMAPPLTHEAWAGVLRRLIEPCAESDLSVYLQVTRGAAPKRDHAIPAGIPPTLFAMVSPIPPRAPDLAERGVSAIIQEDVRWSRCDIKAITLLAAVLMRQAAADREALEAILVRDGQVYEGAASNLFIVRDGGLFTPPKSCLLLPGVTRDLVLELARAAGLPCQERDITQQELLEADEVWLTSSTREIMPVTRLDGRLVGDGRPGPLWRRLDALYQAYKERLRRGEA